MLTGMFPFSNPLRNVLDDIKITYSPESITRGKYGDEWSNIYVKEMKLLFPLYPI
jgi:hypothetical protein